MVDEAEPEATPAAQATEAAMKARKDCDRCHERESDFVLYPEGVDPSEFEAGEAEAVCGFCIPEGAIRVSPFAFQVSS